MDITKIYYPFQYFHNEVTTLAFYGANNPILVSGNLVLRTYYQDDAKTKVDEAHTSEYVKDTIFFETNKLIRVQMHDSYNGKRELQEVEMPEIGKGYILVYNKAEIPSDRYDDHLSILLPKEPEALGVAVLLKRNGDKITWLDRKEALQIMDVFKKQS